MIYKYLFYCQTKLPSVIDILFKFNHLLDETDSIIINEAAE